MNDDLTADLAAVDSDDRLLDALGARTTVLDTTDPALSLLAALADDVDEGLLGLVVSQRSASQGRRPRRRRAARGAVAAAIAVGALSVSGVAAAVSGDPLTPYKKVFEAVSGRHGDLPVSASPVARVHHRLAGVRADIAHGNLAAARQSIADAREMLQHDSGGMSAAARDRLERQLTALEEAVQGRQVGGHPSLPGAEHGQKQRHAVPPPRGGPADKPDRPHPTHAPKPEKKKATEPTPDPTPTASAETSPPAEGGTPTAHPSARSTSPSAHGRGPGRRQ